MNLSYISHDKRITANIGNVIIMDAFFILLRITHRTHRSSNVAVDVVHVVFARRCIEAPRVGPARVVERRGPVIAG